MNFELIVFDSRDQVNAFNAGNSDTTKHAVFVGQAICGLHRHGRRPNKLTRRHKALTTDYVRQWELEVLIPALALRFEETAIN